ncbi:hypothetical protein IQ273_09485 [Nodosilinea sp. LEGE 07298]|nr:hypothetical protein [Nodosilinea sp. LEGE 07298]MBE9109647.1 hypothetical protein [Nodosilinea sp. LEGE 07298]
MDETSVDVSITNLMEDPRQCLKAAGLTNSLVEKGYGLGYSAQIGSDEKG